MRSMTPEEKEKYENRTKNAAQLRFVLGSKTAEIANQGEELHIYTGKNNQLTFTPPTQKSRKKK